MIFKFSQFLFAFPLLNKLVVFLDCVVNCLLFISFQDLEHLQVFSLKVESFLSLDLFSLSLVLTFLLVTQQLIVLVLRNLLHLGLLVFLALRLEEDFLLVLDLVSLLRHNFEAGKHVSSPGLV